jgi:hypothetical protein
MSRLRGNTDPQECDGAGVSMAAASNMTYFLLKASDAENGRYKMMWSKEGRDTYLDTISQPTIGLLG